MFWNRIIRKLKSVRQALKKINNRLYVYSPLPIPFYGSPVGRRINKLFLQLQLKNVFRRLKISAPLFWINTPTGWPVISSFSRKGLIYQRTDDYAAYDFDNFNTEYVKQIDNELIKKSEFVIHVSDELHEEALKITNESLLVTQGVDERFFCKTYPLPKDLESIPRPLIGYIGGMDKYKFDTQLIKGVAKKLPKYSFVLVGHKVANVEELESVPNIYFLGMKKHNQVPAYVHHFDICMVPTANTEWGQKCRPLKMMEYLAAGKPIIATPTPASLSFKEQLIIADDIESWTSSMLKIFEDNSRRSANIQESFTKLNSWNKLADNLKNELHIRHIYI
jgi:glycosyltransferase involved in cell wall biosynthesis